jgi:hypothetical protein
MAGLGITGQAGQAERHRQHGNRQKKRAISSHVNTSLNEKREARPHRPRDEAFFRRRRPMPTLKFGSGG